MISHLFRICERAKPVVSRHGQTCCLSTNKLHFKFIVYISLIAGPAKTLWSLLKNMWQNVKSRFNITVFKTVTAKIECNFYVVIDRDILWHIQSEFDDFPDLYVNYFLTVHLETKLADEWAFVTNQIGSAHFYMLDLQTRVSKSHGLTVVRPRKFFLTLRKILRVVCAN